MALSLATVPSSLTPDSTLYSFNLDCWLFNVSRVSVVETFLVDQSIIFTLNVKCLMSYFSVWHLTNMFKIKHEFYLFSNSATMMVSPPTAISRHLAGRGDPPSDREDLVLALLRAGVVFTTLPRFCCSLGRAFMELPLLMGTFLEVVELCLSGERSIRSGNSGRRLGRYSERDIIDTYLLYLH